MIDLESKKRLIRNQETKVADKLATEILTKPKLSVWMILIPIVFLYYFYAMQRYVKGRRGFVEHFVFTKSLILDGAASTIDDGNKTDFQQLAGLENVPEKAIEPYKKWAKALNEHYLRLLKTEASDYSALVKSAYQDEGRFLLIQNQISKAEVQFYRALRKQVSESAGNEIDLYKKIELALIPLQREEVRLAFS